MPTNDYRIGFSCPKFTYHPSPRGGFVFSARLGEFRSFRGVIRHMPGRLVYACYQDGERVRAGWAAIERVGDLRAKIAELLAWTMSRHVESAASHMVSGLP